MPIKLKENTFFNVGTGVSATETADLDMELNRFLNTDKAVEIRKTKQVEIIKKRLGLTWYQWAILFCTVAGIIVTVIF